MRSIEKLTARNNLRRPSIWAIAAILVLAVVGTLPAGAAAEEAEETTATNCSSAPHHISDLAESGSSCKKALKVAKYAIKNKNSFSWTHDGFHCHGESTEGMPPISFTCKKSISRIYFTYE
ncbi:MAG: hypothetical protein WB507_00990 [Solirubrobacterales bacterium]